MTETTQEFLNKPVLVTGASGFVGSHIVKQLVARGRTVRVLLRKTSSTRALEGLPVEVFYGDVLEPESLRPAMEGCGTVFYSVVDPRFWLSDPAPLYRNNVEGLVNGMEVALACGVERFIFTSTMGTLGLNPNGPVTEDIEFNWSARASTYILARKQAEDRFLEYCRDKGLPGVALCVANTYGPEDHQPTPHGGMVREIAMGRMNKVMDVGQPTIDIRDAAEAAVLAEVHGRVGERYIIANEYARNRDFLGLVAKEGGHPEPKVIPYWLGYGMALIAQTVSKLKGEKDPKFTTVGIVLSDIFRELDNSKARRELHWTPRPLAETVKDTVAWFKQQEAGNSSSV